MAVLMSDKVDFSAQKIKIVMNKESSYIMLKD